MRSSKGIGPEVNFQVGGWQNRSRGLFKAKPISPCGCPILPIRAVCRRLPPFVADCCRLPPRTSRNRYCTKRLCGTVLQVLPDLKIDLLEPGANVRASIVLTMYAPPEDFKDARLVLALDVCCWTFEPPQVVTFLLLLSYFWTIPKSYI